MSTADAELVARSRRHDAEAFSELVERHQRLVFGVALARCHDPALAEDVAQEAFVAAWRDLDRLRDVDRVGSWVAGIARNLAASAARDRARRADVPVLEQASVPTPQDEALAREDRELLQRALADVPDSYRETLVLYYMEGESVAAISDSLGIREDLVKQRLSRGRRALRDGVNARVETVLARARTGPTFRAGVITAIMASGARDATAAATAGKAMTMLATKKVAIAGLTAKTFAAAAVTCAVAGGAVWYGVRGDDKPARSAAQTMTTPTYTTTPRPSLPKPAAVAAAVVAPEPAVVIDDHASKPLPTRVKPRKVEIAPSTPTNPAPASAPAVAAQGGQLRGVLRATSSAARLEGATISVVPGNHTVSSDDDGTFTLDLPAGKYKMKVSMAGYRPFETDLTIDSNGVSIKNIDLQK